MKLQFITLLLLLTLEEMVGRPAIADKRKLEKDEEEDLDPQSDLKPSNLITKNKLKDSIIVNHEEEDENPDHRGVEKEKSPKMDKKTDDNKLKFLSNDLIDGTKLSLDQLKPVDHVDAVKMEQDGHINKEYHKELFLGNHEAIDKGDEETALKKLIDIFKKVDSDSDGHLSEAEMEGWIIQKMEEHFAESIQENDEIFAHLNKDPNGTVPWKVYYTHFLLAKGYTLDQAKKHVVDYDEIDLSQKDKDELIHYKFRWTDADVNPVDNALSKSEFLTFKHPEHSKKTMDSMVYNILNSLDRNEDHNLTKEEFVALPPGEVEGQEFQEMDKQWQKDREREFSEAIDKNGDGVATVEELKIYLDPRNPIQALMEARNLVSLMDDDKDGELSRDEIIKHKNIFLSSKVVDIVGNFHDEF
ncbi:45 kDa calcium-binding protein-like [Gigantopelta aegis]|uniref:45 kDa calcium-binding protein-like n=1 Tax=Gigantopelta aegis TaxID=1735272 RepID=UPI001B88D872|nr:45 kDa calcium-binding protein-like [Gigantopelta aegis]XP_041377793.1 45 kDa calcium-binding protein-like [Gigantopelta aegis]XP_041377795.1 45 kDa calcium-binding protein-like [Gigantopelta aegis]XP_041377796.1 45 kDa calcium-binding protein-like [Gigantopelta aegis]